MKTSLASMLLAALGCSAPPQGQPHRVVLESGRVVQMRLGFAIEPGEPVIVCCKVDGTDCYPVDAAQDCPGGRFVGDCPCPATMPDGTTDCRC